MKPIIVFVGEDNLGLGHDLNYWRDGFLLYLRECYKCETVVFNQEWQFLESIKEISFLHKKGRICVFLVLQTSYDEENLSIIRIVHKQFSLQVPIILLKNISARKKMRKGYYYDDKKMHLKIEKLLKRFKDRIDYFDCKTRQEQDFIISILEKAYENNLKNEERFAVSSLADGIIIEALRFRLLPPELVKEEFDDAAKNINVQQSVFLQDLDDECRKIEKMSQKEREQFRVLLESLFSEVSLGPNVSGFIINTLTSEYAISSGWGNHHLAMLNLENRIERFESLKQNNRSLKCNLERSRRSFFAEGLIFNKVPGFRNAILRIWESDTNEKNFQIGSFMKKEKGLIVVNSKGEILC
jgi:hypothetical protein